MSEEKHPGGRPTKYDPSVCDEVIELGRQGKGKAQIAAALGIRRSTLHAWETDESKPEFSDAIREAQALSEAWWMDQGQEALRDREFNHALWYMNMKNRHGWRDKQEHTGDAKRPIIVMDRKDCDA